MKIALISDIHLEFYRDVHQLPQLIIPEPVDILVCAGDLAPGIDGLKWLSQSPVPVIYTLGNHEFYHSVYQQTLEEIRLAVERYPNITLLEQEFIDIGEVRFLGAVLWTDFDFYGQAEQSMQAIHGRMNDFACIEWQDDQDLRPFYPRDSIEIFQQTLSFYRNNLSTELTNVVISHHLPTPAAVPEQFVGGLLNPAFVSNLDEFMQQHPIKLWLHGHTHSPVDCWVGQTRVVANPHGYYEAEHDKQAVQAQVVEVI